MPSQDLNEEDVRHESSQVYQNGGAIATGQQESTRQRLRQARGPREDLFLSLALNESDLNGEYI